MTRYKAIKVNGKKVDEHRYIMEQALGRPLTRNEVVHHKNGDPRDNRLENLELMSITDHSRMHNKSRPVKASTRRKLSEYKVGRPNSSCRRLNEKDVAYIRQTYIPRDPNYGCRALARKFGVSHSVVESLLNRRTYNT